MWDQRVVRQSFVPLQEFAVTPEEVTTLIAAHPHRIGLTALSGLYGKLEVTYGELFHNAGLGRHLPKRYHGLVCGVMGYLSRVTRRLEPIAGRVAPIYVYRGPLLECRQPDTGKAPAVAARSS